jgi:hypothetical protein
MVVDPFAANLPIWHPKRLGFKAAELATGAIARSMFGRTQVPYMPGDAPGGGSARDAAVSEGLSTTADQRALLAHIAQARASYAHPGAVVELGSWEGHTTAFLARSTVQEVVAVDAYFQRWAPAASALIEFQRNTTGLQNVTLIRDSSVRASRAYSGQPIGLLFVDAQHTFINCLADFVAWKPHLLADAHVVFHDVDNSACPGVRLATYMISRRLYVQYHIHNMLVVRASTPLEHAVASP